MNAEPGQARLDHVILLAASLEQGLDWCHARLGVRPTSGGAHPLMGTHNRLLRIDAPAFPDAYFEIIAIQPGVAHRRPAGARRWFDLDDPGLQAQLATHGPQIAHWVVRVPNVQAAVAAWLALGIDCGPVIAASRQTPQGLLQWRMAVRDDGRRLFDGALPSLIEWGARHPVQDMPESGIHLSDLQITHPQAPALNRAYSAIGLDQLEVGDRAFGIHAQLQMPHGSVTL